MTLTPAILAWLAAALAIGFALGRISAPRPRRPDVDPAPAAAALSRLDDADRARAQALIEDGRLIDAIRLVRERTGLGLKEAKDLVNELAWRMRPPR